MNDYLADELRALKTLLKRARLLVLLSGFVYFAVVLVAIFLLEIRPTGPSQWIAWGTLLIVIFVMNMANSMKINDSAYREPAHVRSHIKIFVTLLAAMWLAIGGAIAVAILA